MSKNPAVYLVAKLIGQANVIPVPTLFLEMLTGDWAAAAFLTQAAYWSDKKQDGWFYKTHADWKKELYLSPDQIRRVTRVLEPFGLQSKLKGIPATLHYRVDLDCLHDRLIDTASNGETQCPDVGKPNAQMLGNPRTCSMGNPTTSTEITSEITSEKQQQRSTPVWKLWVAHCDLKGPSLEANQQEWNEWMGMGMGEELETQAREVIKLGKGDGGYKFPVAGLSCRMKGKINVQHAKLERRVSEEFSAAAVLERQAITPGSRWLHPGSGLACQVAEITGTTVFFEDGGPIEEIWLSHMAGWKPIQGLGAVA